MAHGQVVDAHPDVLGEGWPRLDDGAEPGIAAFVAALLVIVENARVFQCVQ